MKTLLNKGLNKKLFSRVHRSIKHLKAYKERVKMLEASKRGIKLLSDLNEVNSLYKTIEVEYKNSINYKITNIYNNIMELIENLKPTKKDDIGLGAYKNMIEEYKWKK